MIPSSEVMRCDVSRKSEDGWLIQYGAECGAYVLGFQEGLSRHIVSWGQMELCSGGPEQNPDSQHVQEH